MRQLIREFVEIVSATLPILEPVFEFGALQVPGQEGFADLRPFFPGKKYLGADMRSGPGVDMVLDLHHTGLPRESVGTALVLETLEHVEYPRKAIKELHRILRPDGILVLSSVMNFPIHDYPYDYWRYTPQAFRSLLREFPYSFADSVGDESFPHTVIGIGCKGAIPDDSIARFLREHKHWKSCWDNAKSWQESTQIHHYYGHPRPEIVDLVPHSVGRALDVGCGAGAVGKALKERGIQTVVGIELHPEVAEIAAKYLDRVIVGDIERMDLPFPQRYFDCLILADVLEHLRDPWSVVSKLTRYLADDATVICSIPNVRNMGIINSLVEGRWTYTSAGILDRTHLRFFTLAEFCKLLSEAGLSITEVAAVRDPQLFLPPVDPSHSSPVDVNVGRFSIKGVSKVELQELTAVQFLVVAGKKCSLEHERKTVDYTGRDSSVTQRAKPMTSIVILTHNQLEYTRLCVASIRKYTPEPYELIFVDNGSTDGTLDYLKTVAGSRVMANSTNLGFAAGCNQGMSAARGDYILLLNNDTVATEGWLGRMIAHLESSPDIGLVGPRSNHVGGQQQVDIPHVDGEGIQEFARRFSLENDGRRQQTPLISGFCMLVRQAVIDKIGGFDPRFGLGYFEDNDFCLRVGLAGYKVYQADDVVILHFGGRTFSDLSIERAQAMEANWNKFKAKWGIAAERPLSQGYVPDALLKGGFEPQKHFCPLAPGAPEAAEGSGGCTAEETSAFKSLVEETLELEAKGNLAAALEKGEQALKLAKDDPAVLFLSGRMHLCQGKIDTAIDRLAQAIALDGGNPLAHALLGVAFLAKGELAPAEESLKKALELDESLAEAQRSLGHVHFAKGEFQRAADIFHKVARTSEASVDDLVALANCYLELGAYESARIGYEEALRIQPGHELAAENLKRVPHHALK